MALFKVYLTSLSNKKYRWPLLSGLLIGTSYIPFPPWAVLFCYVPLMLWLDEDASHRQQAFWGTWLAQFVLTLIGFHWIAYTATEFGQFPWPLSIITLILFSSLAHLYIPIAALITHEIRRKYNLVGAPVFFIFALTLSLCERLWPTIFPWNLAYGLLWSKIPLYQWADTVGFWGLSCILLLINAWIAWIWQKRDNSDLVFRHVAGICLLLVVFLAGGLVKKVQWKQTDANINVGIIQANIGNLEKIYAEKGRGFRSEIVERYTRLSQNLMLSKPETQLLVWPETALPISPGTKASETYTHLFRDGMGAYGRPVLTGSYGQTDQVLPDGSMQLYNSIFLLNPQGQPLGKPYHKTHLLIFGEYLPLSETFPILLEWLPFISSFARGHGPDILNFPDTSGIIIRFGPQICYEGLFSSFSRGSVEAGAQILVNVTNDSWFGTLFEPKQHMTMTLARAIETRRPLVRSTNTGISTAILASGEQLQQSPNDEAWAGSYQISYLKDPPQTFYVRFGHFDWILVVLGIVGILYRGQIYARFRRP